MIAVSVADKNGRRVTFEAAPGQRLLQAGLAAGIGLPHECGSGTCGNCKATVVNGHVQRLWPNAPGARVCRAANETLLCQSAASANIELTIRSAFTPACDPPCRDTAGTISLMRMLAPDVGLFALSVEDPIAYVPGQFVLLSGLGVDGPRAYSMTECASRDGRLSFLIRKDANGSFTRALFADPSSSREVRIFGPIGRATFSSNEDRPIVAIAGGSGIAGILAILDHALFHNHFRRHPSQLFFGLRDVSSSYLLDELSSAVARANGELCVTIAFSDGSSSSEIALRYPALTFVDGFIHEIVAQQFAPIDNLRSNAPKKPLFFVAGPPPMVDATMRVLLRDCKVSPTEIRYDRFG